MTRRPRASDDRSGRAVSRHAGGRARRRRQYACRLSARPRRFSAHLRASGPRPSPMPTSDDIRALSWQARASADLQPSSVARKLSAVRQLYRFLYAEGNRADDPAAVLEGPKRGRALPKILSIAEVDRLLSAARANADERGQPPAERLRAARLLLPAGSALCHRPARFGTGRAAGVRRAPRPAHADRARQGRQGALVPLNDAARQAR